MKDLFNFYEGTRFTMPFMVYRSIEMWPIFDTIFYNGHIVYCTLVVTLALFYGVNCFMAFNLLSISIFYMITTTRISSRAQLNTTFYGIGS